MQRFCCSDVGILTRRKVISWLLWMFNFYSSWQLYTVKAKWTICLMDVISRQQVRLTFEGQCQISAWTKEQRGWRICNTTSWACWQTTRSDKFTGSYIYVPPYIYYDYMEIDVMKEVLPTDWMTFLPHCLPYIHKLLCYVDLSLFLPCFTVMGRFSQDSCSEKPDFTHHLGNWLSSVIIYNLRRLNELHWSILYYLILFTL